VHNSFISWLARAQQKAFWRIGSNGNGAWTWTHPTFLNKETVADWIINWAGGVAPCPISAKIVAIRTFSKTSPDPVNNA